MLNGLTQEQWRAIQDARSAFGDRLAALLPKEEVLFVAAAATVDNFCDVVLAVGGESADLLQWVNAALRRSGLQILPCEFGVVNGRTAYSSIRVSP
jgi:hypothetical protein